MLLILALWALWASSPMRAQQTTGDILGTVTDPTGAVVPNATIVVENLDTHQRRTVQSSNTGDYLVTLLNPGNYGVRATASGFKAFNVPRIVLAASDRTRVDVNLVTGAATETVTVSAIASELKTDSSVVSNTIDRKQTQDLPLNGRNFVQLVQLVPGANEGPPDSLENGTKLDDRRQSASVSVNGQSDVLNNEMIDGVDNNERLIGTAAVRPSIDAISEMNVQTNTYTAEVGRTGGGIINVITKSGDNQLHGSAFEFFRNDVLDANTFNFGADLPKAKLRQNQFGASLGGPIRKDHTFFFGDYEGYRQVSGTAPLVLTVPTAYEHDHPGDFSDVGGPVIPSTQFDAAGLAYLQMYPSPNSGSNEYIHGFNNVQQTNNFDVRVDQNFNPANMAYARFTYNHVYTDSPGPFPDVTVQGLTLNPNSIFYALGNATDVAYSGMLNYTHVFNPKVLLELKAAYTRVDNQSYPETDGLNPNEKFGQPNVNTPISDSTGLAPISVLSGASLGSVFYQPLKDQDNTFQYMGTVTYTMGNHSLKFGAGLTRRQLTSFQSGSPEGYWIFSDYPSLLEGNYVSNARTLQLVVPHLRVWEPSVYVQDDWRLSTKLTLNLGLRYDVYTPYTEVSNSISTFNPATAALQIAGQNGISNTAGIQTDYHGLAPRFGFAWNPGSGFVVRGGYGIGYFPYNATSVANLKNPPFVASVSTCSSYSGGCGNGTKFIDGFAPPTPTSIDLPNSSIPVAVSPKFRTSYIQQFNLTLQKEVHANVFTLTYVGLLGRQLGQVLPDLNAPRPNSCGTDAACYRPLRPYYSQHPNLGLIGFFQTGGSSSYHALQASAERRLTQGLALNANYQWAHGLDNASPLSETGAGGYGSVPPLVSTLEYGNSQLDIRHRIAGTINYQLPFGAKANGLQAIAIKGWQTNVIGVWETGFPFTITNATDVSNTNPGANNADRPDRIGKPSVHKGDINEFFNTAAFAAQTPGTIGTERRNGLHGPDYRHLDLSLFKVFPIGERFNLEFRAESFNLLNTANFAVPNSSLGGANFGRITALSTNYAPRQLQFALKLTF